MFPVLAMEFNIMLSFISSNKGVLSGSLLSNEGDIKTVMFFSRKFRRLVCVTTSSAFVYYCARFVQYINMVH